MGALEDGATGPWTARLRSPKSLDRTRLQAGRKMGAETCDMNQHIRHSKNSEFAAKMRPNCADFLIGFSGFLCVFATSCLGVKMASFNAKRLRRKGATGQSNPFHNSLGEASNATVGRRKRPPISIPKACKAGPPDTDYPPQRTHRTQRDPASRATHPALTGSCNSLRSDAVHRGWSDFRLWTLDLFLPRAQQAPVPNANELH